MLDIDMAHLLPLHLEDFIGERVAVLGISGTGKTTTVAVLIEELLGSGLVMTIVDTEGEYYGLKEQHDLLVAGKSMHVELPIGIEHAGALARASVEQGFSVILDVSGYKGREAQQFLEQYFMALWDACSIVRRPYEVVLEEAHVWCPQEKDTPLKTVLTDVALRGRKRGLGIILASQRSAKVEKDILTQVPLLFLHQVVHPIDISVYKGLLPLPAKEVERVVSGLRKGHVVAKVDNVPYEVQIRPRHTFHPGSTPEFGAMVQPALRQVDAALLEELQQVLAASVVVPSSATKEKRLERRIQELESLLAERDAIIADQMKQIEQLSRLTVSLDGAGLGTLGLPEVLQIAHAHIETATVQQANSPVLPLRVVESLPANQEESNGAGIAFSDRPKINSLQKLFKGLDPKQYEVFKLLVGHETAMSVRDIATWMGVKENTAQGHIPLSLLQLGLLKRVRRGNAYVYTAQLKEYLEKALSSQADIPILMKWLLP